MAVTATPADYVTVAQQLYIAYFGRPADAFGLINMTQALAAAGAPTDEAGFSAAYATNSTVKTIIDNFGNSTESAKLYGTGTTSSFVTAIFQNVLGRDPQLTGLKFWVDAIDQGVMTKAQAAENILAAAVKTNGNAADAATVAAKLAVASDFTNAITSTAELNAYSGATAAAAARAMLHGVDGTTDATTFPALASSTLANIVTGVVATTTALTTGVDTLVGTAGNDVFNGTVNGATATTFTALDSIDGAGGYNTLNLVDVTGGTLDLSIATIKNIQSLNVTSSSDLKGDAIDVSAMDSLVAASFNVKTTVAQTITVSDTTAVTVNNTTTVVPGTVVTAGPPAVLASDAITIVGGSSINVTTLGAVTATNNAALTSATITNAAGATISDGSDSDTTLTNVSLTGTTAASTLTGNGIVNVSLSHLAVDTTINNTTDHTETLSLNKVTGGTITDAGATAVVVNAISNASKAVTLDVANATSVGINASVGLTLAAADFTDATAITLTGAGKIAITAATVTAALKTIDASADTGGVNLGFELGAGVTFTGGAGADSIIVGAATNKAITTGAGNDTVTVHAAMAAHGSVDAGAGTNTLAGAAADIAGLNAAALAQFTNFQTLKITDAFTGSVDVSSIAGVTNFVAGAGVAAAGGAVSGLGANATVTLTGDLSAVLAPGASVLTIGTHTDGASDVLNLVLDHAYTSTGSGTAAAPVVVDAYEAVAASSHLESLNINSTANITQADTPAAGAAFVSDTVTNHLTLTDAYLTHLTVTGDQALVLAVDAGMTVLTTIDASANTAGVNIDASAWVAGSAALTITGSATAANTLTGGGANDTIIGGAGNDVITGGAGGDTLTSGGGHDTFIFNAGDSSIGTGTFDTITDFVANTYGNSAVTAGAVGTGATGVAAKNLTGSVLSFTAGGSDVAANGAVTDVFQSAADATTFLANHHGNGAVTAALDATNHNLYVDVTGDGVADFYIHLTGISTINAAAIVVH